jgi:hypothetical protein
MSSPLQTVVRQLLSEDLKNLQLWRLSPEQLTTLNRFRSEVEANSSQILEVLNLVQKELGIKSIRPGTIGAYLTSCVGTDGEAAAVCSLQNFTLDSIPTTGTEPVFVYNTDTGELKKLNSTSNASRGHLYVEGSRLFEKVTLELRRQLLDQGLLDFVVYLPVIGGYQKYKEESLLVPNSVETYRQGTIVALLVLILVFIVWIGHRRR